MTKQSAHPLPPPHQLILEVCAASLSDCLAAREGGADRVELNTALSEGGLTPSLGLIAAARAAIPIPIIVMIRPRPGGFCYSRRELDVMERDIQLALEAGARGVACGVLDSNSRVDVSACRCLCKAAKGAEVVFHRAFDLTPDADEALAACLDLGVSRILTSGQARTALEGASLIKRLISRSEGRLGIVAAAGIRSDTVLLLLERSGCRELHGSFSGIVAGGSPSDRPDVGFRGQSTMAEEEYRETGREEVARLREILDSRSSRL